MKIRIHHAWALCGVLAAPAACDAASISPRVPPVSAPIAASTPSANPVAALEPATLPAFDGVVAERIRTGGYAYLRVQTDATSQWVATMGEGHPRGSHVRVASLGVRHDFHSRRLDRDFDTLVFATVEDATKGVVR